MSETQQPAGLDPDEETFARLRATTSISFAALIGEIDRLREQVAALTAERDEARRYAQSVEVDRDVAEARLAQVREALAFYADPNEWAAAKHDLWLFSGHLSDDPDVLPQDPWAPAEMALDATDPALAREGQEVGLNDETARTSA